MTHIKVKPFQKGVKMEITLTDKNLPDIPKFLYSEREVDLVTRAFTQGRCSKESLHDYLKRIGAVK